MSSVSEEYRGYAIEVTAIKDREDLWDFQYSIARLGVPQQLDGAQSIIRKHTMGGHLTPEIAARAGLELARTEIDNRLALSQV
ncbi:hypothetical protein ACLB1G_06065 [Oxalobacteraceae bacterium A2-2]